MKKILIAFSLSQKGRAGSLESNLVKRPSIDSGINMADAFRSSSAIDKSESSSARYTTNPKFHLADSWIGHTIILYWKCFRWERSMSLPLDSDTSEDSFGDSKIGRRMDLALCKSQQEVPPDRIFSFHLLMIICLSALRLRFRKVPKIGSWVLLATITFGVRICVSVTRYVANKIRCINFLQWQLTFWFCLLHNVCYHSIICFLWRK
jgi:hypothetical protein